VSGEDAAAGMPAGGGCPGFVVTLRQQSVRYKQMPQQTRPGRSGLCISQYIL